MRKLTGILIMVAVCLQLSAQYVPIIAEETVGDIYRKADTRITHWDNVKFQLTTKTYEYRLTVPFLPAQQTHTMHLYLDSTYTFIHNGSTYTNTGRWFLSTIFGSVNWDLVGTIGLNLWRQEYPQDTLFIKP